MKKVFSNSREVCHVWASQSQSEGRCANVYFEGATVYSYGRHYPLGIILTNKKGEKAALINATGYSITTTKHISEARQATNHYKQFSIYSTNLMEGIRAANWSNTLNLASLQQSVQSYIARRYESLASQLSSLDAQKRRPVTLEKWRNEALSEIQSALDVLEWVGGKIDAKTRKLIELASGDMQTMRAKVQKLREAEARKKAAQAKKDAEARAKVTALAIPAWIAGERVISLEGQNYDTYSALQYASQIYMRVEGNEVVTSRGARFPLEHGLKALPLIRAIVSRGENWQRNGKTIHLGHYQIDSISEGLIVAGCHKLPVSEVERLAASLGV